MKTQTSFSTFDRELRSISQSIGPRSLGPVFLDTEEESWVEDEHHARIDGGLCEIVQRHKKQKPQADDNVTTDERPEGSTFGSGRYPKRIRVPKLRHWMGEHMVNSLSGEVLRTVKYDDISKELVTIDPKKRPNLTQEDEVCGKLLIAPASEAEKLTELYSTLKADQLSKMSDALYIQDLKTQREVGIVNCNENLYVQWLHLKPLQSSKMFVARQAQLGTVLSCKNQGLELTLDEDTYKLSVWDNFTVHEGSSFSLKNLSKSMSVRLQLISRPSC